MVRIVVPFSAGSITDGLARILADKLTLMWKQQVIVENRAGPARHDRRREGAARRLHADAHLQRSHHRGRHQQEPAVRSGEGFRRRQPGRRGADGHDRAAGFPGKIAQGIHRRWRRKSRGSSISPRPASPAPRSLGRDHAPECQRQHGACALQGRAGSRHLGRARRRADVFRADPGRAGTRCGRQGHGDGDQLGQARAATARIRRRSPSPACPTTNTTPGSA